MSTPIPEYAEKAMCLADAAHDMARLLESDVQIRDPAKLIAVLRSTAIALGISIRELADAADAAGQGAAATRLREALASQQESAQPRPSRPWPVAASACSPTTPAWPCEGATPA